jgi:branched-chain amino acid transport system ATP-binding protein
MTAAGGAELTVQGLTLSFGGNVALNRVDLRASAGEMISLVGPNGAGKTSVFNCITGFYRPQQGEVRLDGDLLTGRPPHRIAAMGIARTFQNVELFRLSVLDNILLGRHALMRAGLLRSTFFTRFEAKEEAANRQRAEEILAFLGISSRRHEQVGNLPLGTQKLVEIGRALALEPRVLLLDEPTAAMGRDDKEDVARHILRIRRSLGITIILIEHDMRFVMDLSDRVFVLNFGENLAVGTPREVTANPDVVRAYLGEHAVADDAESGPAAATTSSARNATEAG